MKRSTLAIGAAVLVLAVQSSYPAQSTSSIEGVVLDAATNQPLTGVRIGLSSRGATPVAFTPPDQRVLPSEAITDSQGRFTIEAREAGRFRVVPMLDGYVYSRPGQKLAPAEPGVWVQVSPGSRIQNLELRMARPAAISGRVLDASGQPIVGTAGSVVLMRYTYGTDGIRTLGWVPGIVYPRAAGSFQRMNDQGEFRFYDVPPGEYYLSVSGGGGAIGSQRSYFYPGVADVSRAEPIRVTGGEDLRLGTLALPQREKGVQVKLQITGTSEPRSGGIRVYIAGGLLIMGAPPNPTEVVLSSVAPGHYDVVLRTDSILRGADLFYARFTLDLGSSNVQQEVAVQRGARVNGRVLIEDESGTRSPAPPSLGCTIRSSYGLDNCVGSQVVPGFHELDFQDLPPNMYLLSVMLAGEDVLPRGINITGDTELEIVLATPGAVVEGTVRDAGGVTLPDAVVALVPDAPYRDVGPRYRSVITDPNGGFEIHGIAPGSYKLFSWPELEGAAYRNAEFMKEFEERGKPVRIEKGSRLSVDVTAF